MCQKCEGTGILEYTDYVPYGMGSVAMASSEHCECTELGCPQCGNPATWDYDTDNFLSCPECGYNVDAEIYTSVSVDEKIEALLQFLNHDERANNVIDELIKVINKGE